MGFNSAFKGLRFWVGPGDGLDVLEFATAGSRNA